MLRQPLRIAAATFQVAGGLIAVFLTAYTLALLIDPSSVDATQSLVVGTFVVLGMALFAVWAAARTRRPWLMALVVITGVLSIMMIVATSRLYAPAQVNEQLGIWTGITVAGVGAALWLLIMVAAFGELRLLVRSDAAQTPPWSSVPALLAPIALLTAVVMVAVSSGPGWLIRLNSRVTESGSADKVVGSSLSGESRWTQDVASSGSALAIGTGVAIPVPRDQDHSAGVIMLDPTTGQTRWRYQLQGADGAPKLATTDGGRAVAVTFDGFAGEDVPQRTFTLSADSGRVVAMWPDRGSVQGTDPPVLFDRDAQGTNAVIAISPTGRKLWTYQPDRCADPRGVSSTPSVMLVRARQCGKRYNDLQILGLDAKTGEQRWAQPEREGEDASGPEDVLVRKDFQLELGNDELARRDLTSGAVAWTMTSAADCRARFMDGSDGVAYVGECPGGEDEETTEIVGYAMKTGRPAWRQRLDEPIKAMAAVDDNGVLALTVGEKSCTLRLVRETGDSALMRLRGGQEPDRDDPGALNCHDATLIRVGGAFVLRVRLLEDSISGADRYRFIGLA